MAELVYPSLLPGPQAAPVQWAERRMLSSLPGPRASRAIERDQRGSQQVSFLFDAAEAAVFRAWHDADLTYGGAWFAADWPSPQANVRVRRFIGAPQWQFVPGGLWRVSAQCEVRGRGEVPLAFAYQLALLADAPLVYWKLDESAGAPVAEDSGSLGLPATINPALCTFGAHAAAEGRARLALTTDGYNAATAAHDAALNFDEGFTISALVTRTPVTHKASIVTHGVTNGNWGNWLFTVSAAGRLTLELSDADSLAARTPFEASIALTSGARHHVVARWEADGTVNLFQDMVLVATGTYSEPLWLANSLVGLGCFPHVDGSNPESGFFAGSLDEVAIWNRALSTERLQHHFDQL